MGRYDDLMHMETPIHLRHPRMSMEKRAAQFMPFAALTGYGASIDEAGRQTQVKPILDDQEKALLDMKLDHLSRVMASGDQKTVPISLTIFVEDDRKAGGSFQTIRGNLLKIDLLEKILLVDNGLKTPVGVEEIIDIDSDLLQMADGYTFNEVNP